MILHFRLCLRYQGRIRILFLGTPACASLLLIPLAKMLPAIGIAIAGLGMLLQRTRFAEQMLVAPSTDDFSSMADGASS